MTTYFWQFCEAKKKSGLWNGYTVYPRIDTKLKMLPEISLPQYSCYGLFYNNNIAEFWDETFYMISYDEYFSQYQDIGVSDDNLENLDLSYEKYIEEIKKFLSPEDFQLFTYACIEKLSIIQISLLLNINFNTAKSRIRRMKSKLKLFLSDF